MNPCRRYSQFGNSFVTCLLTAIMFFGAIGFYYFAHYQWLGLEKPLDGLDIVQNVPRPQMNDFRKKAVAKLCDPTLHQLTRISKMRRATAGADKPYAEFDQDCIEVKNRLKEIADEARLKRIPKKFEKRYSDGLSGAGFAYRALLALEETLETQDEKKRKNLVKESREFSAKAKKRLTRSREYFSGDEWAQEG